MDPAPQVTAKPADDTTAKNAAPAAPRWTVGDMLGRGYAFLSGGARLYKAAFAVFAALAIYHWSPFSLTALYRWYNPPQGLIFVDSPEVYTRERLINERSIEEAWLYEKLQEADSEDALAGISRIIESHLSYGEPAAEPKKDSPPPAPKAAAAETAAKATSYLSFDNRIRIESANRDLILQKIVENRLDDRHDLDGNSLYILKFDTTVVVNDHSGRRAMVQIRLEPPFADGNGAGKSADDEDESEDSLDQLGALRSVRSSDSKTLLFIKSAFNKFIKDSGSRLNAAIAKELRNTTAGKRDMSIDAVIRRAAASEFGLDEDEVRIGSSITNQRGKDGQTVQLRQKLLNISAMDKFVSLIANEPPAGAPSGGNLASIRFSTQERKINFELLDHACEHTESETKGTPDLKSATEIDLTGAPKLQKLFGLSTADAIGGKKVRLYTSLDGFVLQNTRAHQLLLDLLERAIDGTETAGEYRQDALFQLTFYNYDKSNGNYVRGPLANKAACLAIKGTLPTGLVNFVSRVKRYNNYAYSVLPRQSPVAIIDDIVNDIVARLPATDGILGLSFKGSSHLRGAKLQSRVTSFGYVSQTGVRNNNDLTVGWMIDPRAGRIGEPEDLTISSVDSIMAIVSVPSWWPSINVVAERTWLEADGHIVSYRADAEPADAPQQLFTVNLPSDQHVLESTLINNDLRRPKIESSHCTVRKVKQVVKEKEVELSTPTCVITGKRLWRNPVVLLGATRHKFLTVMPDMDGLLVDFPEDADPCNGAELSVWTSEGSTSDMDGAHTRDCDSSNTPSANKIRSSSDANASNN